MADASVRLRWTGEGLGFRGLGSPSRGQGGDPIPATEIPLDGDRRTGPSPVEALLLALASCNAADVVDILGKMRVPLDGLEVVAEGDRAPHAPRRFTAIRLHYVVRGLPPEAEPKLRQAIELSREKYCSVLHTLRPDVVVESDVALQ